MKRLLTAHDFRAMPWANGKGVTLELARADVQGVMLWRLSRASVVQDGPFSTFAAVERCLTVLTGPGFDLVGPGITLQARPFVPVEFPGDVPIRAVGVTAPSDDFNVMSARHLPKPQVQVLRVAQRLATCEMAIYWPEKEQLLLTDEGHDFAGDGPAIAVFLPR